MRRDAGHRFSPGPDKTEIVMQRIPIMLALPGMTLARNICREDGAAGPPICGKGVTLTVSLIERLKRMGVQTITVEGHPVRMEDDKAPEELLEDLDRRFRKAADDPLTGNLKEIYRAIIEKASGEQCGRQAD